MTAARVVDDGSGQVGLHGRFHIHNVRQNRLESGLNQFIIRRIAHPPAQHYLTIRHHGQLFMKTVLSMMMAVIVMVVVMVMITSMARFIP
jgi:hypothetical protein